MQAYLESYAKMCYNIFNNAKEFFYGAFTVKIFSVCGEDAELCGYRKKVHSSRLKHIAKRTQA